MTLRTIKLFLLIKNKYVNVLFRGFLIVQADYTIMNLINMLFQQRFKKGGAMDYQFLSRTALFQGSEPDQVKEMMKCFYARENITARARLSCIWEIW